jgi:hypothetical protein
LHDLVKVRIIDMRINTEETLEDLLHHILEKEKKR